MVLSDGSTPPDESRRGGPPPWLVALAIAGLALFLRVAHLYQLNETELFDERDLISDTRYYDLRADEIARHDFLGRYPGYLSPLYCYVLAALYRLPFDDMASAKLFQALLGAASAVLVYLIGRRVFSDAVGAIAGTTAAVYGLFVFYTGLLFPTTLLLFLHLAAISLLVTPRPGLGRFATAGLLIGMAVTAKANALLLVGAVPLWIVLAFRREVLGKRALWIGAYLLGAALAIAPFTWRNYVVSGQTVLVTTTGGRNLLKGNGPGATGSHVELDLAVRGTNLKDYLLDRVDVESTIREDREMRAEAWALMLGDPLRTLGLLTTKLRLFLYERELGIRDQYQFMRRQTPLLSLPLPGFGLVVPLGLAGLLVFAGRDRRTALLAVVLLTQAASFVLVFVLARYRVVSVAVLLPFAAAFVLELGRRALERNWTAAGVRLTVLVAAALVVHVPVPGFDGPEPVGRHLEYLGDRAKTRLDYDRALEYYAEALEAPWLSGQKRNQFDITKKRGECFAGLGQFGVARRIWNELADEIETTYGRAGQATADELRRRAKALPASRPRPAATGQGDQGDERNQSSSDPE